MNMLKNIFPQVSEIPKELDKLNYLACGEFKNNNIIKNGISVNNIRSLRTCMYGKCTPKYMYNKIEQYKQEYPLF